MFIEHGKEGDFARLYIHGDFIFSENPDFTDFWEVLRSEDVEGAILDFENCFLIDSTALGLIMQTQEILDERGLNFRIRNAEGQVLKMLMVSGYGSYISSGQSAA